MKFKRLDPRTLFIMISCVIVTTLRSHHLTMLLGMSALGLLAYKLAGVPLRRWGQNVLLVVWLLIFIGLGSLWGQAASSHSPWHEIGQSLIPVLQLVILVGWGTLLGAVVSAFEMATAFDHFLRPLRKIGIPVQPLSVIVMLSLRFLPLLREEYQILVKAHIVRGIDVTPGDFMTYARRLGALGVPLWHNLLRRVEHVTLAMESRAFRVQGDRTGLYELRMTFLDYLVVGIGVLILVGSEIRF